MLDEVQRIMYMLAYSSEMVETRKSLITIQGVRKEYNYNKILKDFKKEFCCNGTIVQDWKVGQVWHSAFSVIDWHSEIFFHSVSHSKTSIL